jgi:hypothetical protein
VPISPDSIFSILIVHEVNTELIGKIFYEGLYFQYVNECDVI